MEVEITIRVRAEVPDGTHLPALSVARDLIIPLRYLTRVEPTPLFVDLMPSLLTFQSQIRKTPQAWPERPIDDALVEAAADD